MDVGPAARAAARRASDRPADALEGQYRALLDHLRAMGSAVVAFSGGVDSAFLLRAAFDALGDRAQAVFGSSPSVPRDVEARAVRVAAQIGARLRVVPSGETGRPAYLANGPDRCYHCKDSLYELLLRLSQEDPGAVVLDGTNRDDLSDERPGLRAVRERGARSPLADLGWTKREIREMSRRLGLETWDAPASPCLSSRIPHGTPVTEEALARIDGAERALRALGFQEVRVRHHGDLARIEVPRERLQDLLARAAEVLSGVRAAGYVHVTVDLAGYRAGGANAVGRLEPPPPEPAGGEMGCGAAPET